MKARLEKSVNDNVKLANQRFGLEYLIKELCLKLEFPESKKTKLIELAKNRHIEKMIKEIN